jgi:hypothetical protein
MLNVKVENRSGSGGQPRSDAQASTTRDMRRMWLTKGGTSMSTLLTLRIS